MGKKITIVGDRVHNVGYRLFILTKADDLFIERLAVRNIKIDRKQGVLILVDGNEDQLREFIEMIKTEKPEKAIVDEIRVEDYGGSVPDIERVRNMLNTKQLGKIVDVGLKLLDEIKRTRKELGEKIDDVGRKVDEVAKKVDKVAEKVDKVAEKVDKAREELGEKIDLLRTDLKTYMEERFRKIEEEIARIKAKIGMV